MVKYILSCLFCIAFLTNTSSQITRGLVGYYSFDNCDGNDDSGNGVDGILLNNPSCDCGVKGDALLFDGIDDAVIIPGSSSYMNTRDFSISLYFKSTGTILQDLISRKEFCNNENAFSMQVNPLGNKLTTTIAQNNSKELNFINDLSPAVCWHHVVFVREGNFQSIWMNGKKVQEENSVTRINLENDNIELELSGGPCLGLSDAPFRGFVDELRIYNRALDPADIQELYFSPDKIITQDTLVFLGTSLDVITNSNCSFSYSWSPPDGIADLTAENPTITPTETTVYTAFFNQGDCIASDSIRVAVVDPSELDCKNIFVANAFTPNFDGNNDNFSVSNPYAVTDFISFEVYDRWGGQMFYSTDIFASWDGTFAGKEVNPGVFLYRVRFRCDGVEETKTGSVTLIR